MKRIKQISILILVASIILINKQVKSQTPNWSKVLNTSGTGDEYMNDITFTSNGDVYYSGTFQSPTSIAGTTLFYYPNMLVRSFLGYKSKNGTNNWTITIGGNTIMFASIGGLAADPSGNLFFRLNTFGGAIGDTVYIGQNHYKLLTRTSGMTLIVKINSQGNVLWTNEISEGATNEAGTNNLRMISDSNGDLYIAGFFFFENKFDSISVTPIGAFDANFIAKCSANGDFQWVKKFGSKGNDGQTIFININSQNEVYLSGGWEGDTLFVDGQVLVNPSPGGFFNTDRYIAKFSPAGNLLWLKREGSLDSDDISSISIMNNGDIICHTIMGNNPLTVNGNQTIAGGASWLLTKYDASGNFLSYKKLSFPAESFSHMTTDGTDLFISNSFSGPQLTYGNTTLNNAGGTFGTFDLAVLKLDTQYNLIWATKIGDQESETSNGLIFNINKGLIIAAGSTSSQLIIGNDTMINVGLLTSEALLLLLDVLNVGINNNSIADKISCYPNPSKDFLYLNFDTDIDSEVEIKVISTSAKVMMKKYFSSNLDVSLDIESLPSGVYFLEIKLGNSYAVKKIVKE